MRNCKLLLIGLALLSPTYYATAQLSKDGEKIFKENFYQAEETIADGNYTAALPMYQELNAMDGENANINWRIGLCFLNTSNEKGKALPYLEKAISKKQIKIRHSEKTPPGTVIVMFSCREK